MRGASRSITLAAGLFALVASGCGEPTLPDLPARCSDNVCPDGLACIHGVCAEPGTPVPITIVTLNNFLARDLKIVPQATSVLVTWQTYAYSEEGERFVGVRVTGDGAVSPEMTLVSSFEADADETEPFYDVLATSDTELLVAVSAAPLGSDPSPEPRLITYNVKLPAQGHEADGAKFGSPWPEELRMSTIGFGAVSKPKLVSHGAGVLLGYVRTRTTPAPMMMSGLETIGELAVIGLEIDGTPLAAGASYYRARDGLPVAVGVEGAFEGAGGVFWALDQDRPSAVFLNDAGAVTETKLDRLAIALSAEGSTLSYLKPSLRTGEKLGSDPVAGPSSLHALVYSEAGGVGSFMSGSVGEMPVVRDTPRPAWVPRKGKPSLLVTPGAEESAPSLVVIEVDGATAANKEVARIDRFSASPVDAVVAAVSGGRLFVAWADGEDTSVIRMAIVDEP